MKTYTYIDKINVIFTLNFYSENLTPECVFDFFGFYCVPKRLEFLNFCNIMIA